MAELQGLITYDKEHRCGIADSLTTLCGLSGRNEPSFFCDVLWTLDKTVSDCSDESLCWPDQGPKLGFFASTV